MTASIERRIENIESMLAQVIRLLAGQAAEKNPGAWRTPQSIAEVNAEIAQVRAAGGDLKSHLQAKAAAKDAERLAHRKANKRKPQ